MLFLLKSVFSTNRTQIKNLRSGCRKSPALGCFLLSSFGFYASVFGALPPFPTSFLVPKKEAKKASAAAPLTVVLLKAVVFRQSDAD